MDLVSAESLAKSLLHFYKLSSWNFMFDRARVRFGSCRYQSQTITLSKVLTELNNEETVKMVILHEIAHALAGRKAGHGKKWKEILKNIGGIPERCFSPAQVSMPKGKYTAICPKCAKTFPAQRKRRGACKSCCKTHNGGRYSFRFELIFTKNEGETKKITHRKIKKPPQKKRGIIAKILQKAFHF